MAKFGLTVHTGKNNKASKMEAMFIPSTRTLYCWRNPNTITYSNSTSNFTEISKWTLQPINLEEIYYNSPETDKFIAGDDRSYIIFAHCFKYLRSIIDFLLDDTTDINARINATNKVIGVMEFIWDTDKVSLEMKFKLYIAILVNFAL